MVMVDDNWSGEPLTKGTCVVFGGRGFVGRLLVYRLLKLNKWIVRVADSSPFLHLDLSTQSDSTLSEAIAAGSASYHRVDVKDQSKICRSNTSYRISIMYLATYINFLFGIIFCLPVSCMPKWFLPRSMRKQGNSYFSLLFPLKSGRMFQQNLG